MGVKRVLGLCVSNLKSIKLKKTNNENKELQCRVIFSQSCIELEFTHLQVGGTKKKKI